MVFILNFNGPDQSTYKKYPKQSPVTTVNFFIYIIFSVIYLSITLIVWRILREMLFCMWNVFFPLALRGSVLLFVFSFLEISNTSRDLLIC